MKKMICWSVVMMAGLALAGDPYLVLGKGKMLENAKGKSVPPIVEALGVAIGGKESPAPVEVAAITNDAALAALKGRSFEGVFLITVNDEKHKFEEHCPSAENLKRLNAFLDTVKTKATIVIVEGGAFENYVRCRDAFAGRAGVITLRDGARIDWEWGVYAPVAMKRMAKAIKAAADPAERDWLHPLPAKIYRDGSDLVLDYDSPALHGKSLVVSDTLWHKYYIRSKGRTNWTHADAIVVGNTVRLSAKSIPEPWGVRLAWWWLSPVSNADHMPGPGFNAEMTDSPDQKPHFITEL